MAAPDAQRPAMRWAFGWAMAGALAVTLIYLPGLRAFFANDDWVLLGHYGRIPWTEPWRFFDPACVWFYRPLQSWLYAILFQTAGMDPVPYNVVLFGLHLTAVALVYAFLREYVEDPWLTVPATVLFAAHSAYGDILLWKANYNTLFWVILTLLTCLAFGRFLRTGDRRWLWATYGLTVATFAGKELAANLPLILTFLYLYRRTNPDALAGPQRGAEAMRLIREGVRVLWPVAALVIVVLAAHRMLVRNIYELWPPAYPWASLGKALVQPLQALQFILLPFLRDPNLLAASPSVSRWLQEAGRAVPLAGPAVLVVALLRRDRVLLFGLGWCLVPYLPTVFLEHFQAGRYAYLSVPGAALIWARLAQLAWLAAARHGSPMRRLIQAGTVAALFLAVISNLSITRVVTEVELAASDRAVVAYEAIRAQRGAVPPGSLVVLQNPPKTYFYGGLGAREMARLALNDPQAEGIMDGQPLTEDRRARVLAIPDVLFVDMQANPPTVERVRQEVARH